MDDAVPKMYVEWLKSDCSQSTIVNRWKKKVLTPEKLNSRFTSFCRKAGGSKTKSQIRNIKKEAIIEAKKRSYEEVKEAVKEQQVKSALDHVEFMDRNLKKSAETIDKFEFKSRIDQELDTLKKHDDLSRKAFGLDQLTEEVASERGKLNLAVLINFDPSEASQSKSESVLDAELV